MRTPTLENFSIPNQEDYDEISTIFYNQDDLDNKYQSMYLACPRNSKEPFPTIVWLHGGGLREECIDQIDTFFNGTIAVASIRYRLSPQHLVPAPLEDAAMAVAWVKNNIASYGGDPDKIILGGMSAGSWIAGLVGMDPKYLEKHGLDHKSLTALILLSGQMTTHFQAQLDLEYPRANIVPMIDQYAPFNYVSADLPPILLATGTRELDMERRASENMFFTDTLKSLGHKHVEYYQADGTGHSVHVANPIIINRFLQSVGCFD